MEISYDASFHMVGLLGVALRLCNCVPVMLLTLGAKALPQTQIVVFTSGLEIEFYPILTIR